MLINGNAQSAAFRREQGLRALEPIPGTRGMASPSVEAGFRARPQWADVEGFLLSRRQELALLGDPIDRNRRGQDEPEFARPDYTTSYGFGLRGSYRKPTGLVEGFKNVGKRWALDDTSMAKILHLEEEIGLSQLILSGNVPPITGDIKDRMALVIGISIGLGELFNDDEVAERQWLNSARSELGGLSPLKHMLEGELLNIRDAVDLLDSARGLR